MQVKRGFNDTMRSGNETRCGMWITTWYAWIPAFLAFKMAGVAKVFALGLDNKKGVS